MRLVFEKWRLYSTQLYSTLRIELPTTFSPLVSLNETESHIVSSPTSTPRCPVLTSSERLCSSSHRILVLKNSLKVLLSHDEKRGKRVESQIRRSISPMYASEM
ncbi:hypothetical protein AAC387_Pa07g1596 [Persea americana]